MPRKKCHEKMKWKTEIYLQYMDKIFGFILSHVKAEEIALDLTHDVFTRLYSTYSYKELENVESIIWTITRNRIVDHHRKVAHSRKYRDYLWNQIQSSNTVLDQIEYQETEALYQQAIKSLTPQQWKIYNLAREQEMSYSEIGKQLQLSPNTVKNHMVGALRSIRTFLKEHQEKITVLILLAGLNG